MSYHYDQAINTAHFFMEIDTSACYGYFEHHRLGDGCGGGLWFAVNDHDPQRPLELTDYDGTEELPREVCQALRAAGFLVSPEFD